jgi:hypothetical protein
MGRNNIFSIAVGLQHGFIFAHSDAVQNTKGANPTGAELIFSWQRNDAAVYDLCNCYPRRGLMFGYYDYNNNILGKGVTAAYFLEPVYKLHKNFLLSFKASAGASYLNNPFDSISNPSNQSYSTRANAYLLLGVGVWIPITRHWSANASLNYQHQSNGGLKLPNKGINMPTVGLSLSYQHEASELYKGNRTYAAVPGKKATRLHAVVFAIAKRVTVPNEKSRRLPVIGISVEAGKKVGRISAVILASDMIYDKALASQLREDSISASAVRVGLSAGHEFILGRFLFNQRIGIYIFSQAPYFDRIYHRWGLQYLASDRISIALHLHAHRHVADFADVGISFSLQKRRSYLGMKSIN